MVLVYSRFPDRIRKRQAETHKFSERGSLYFYYNIVVSLSFPLQLSPAGEPTITEIAKVQNGAGKGPSLTQSASNNTQC